MSYLDRFKDRIIDQKSTEERQKNDYAVYFQNPEEVDARDYSLQYAQQIVDSALKSPDLTQQNKVWLSRSCRRSFYSVGVYIL